MALSFPVPVAAFFDMVPIAKIKMRPGRAVSFSETGGGEVITHGVGSRLWQGEITLGKEYHNHIAAIEARLSLLEEPGASLLIHDIRHNGPIADPGAVGLGGATVRIAALDPNNQELALKGLPAGYTISTGDLMGFRYGANPSRYAYHRVVVGAVANGVGTTPLIQVTPFLRPGAALDADVTLQRPVLKAVLREADYGAGRATVSEGGTFSFIQTLR